MQLTSKASGVIPANTEANEINIVDLIKGGTVPLSVHHVAHIEAGVRCPAALCTASNLLSSQHTHTHMRTPHPAFEVGGRPGFCRRR